MPAIVTGQGRQSGAVIIWKDRRSRGATLRKAVSDMANEEKARNLTNEEFDDLNKIIKETLNALIECADKHNIDRDSFIKYFCFIFGTMAEISTFERYTRYSEVE